MLSKHRWYKTTLSFPDSVSSGLGRLLRHPRMLQWSCCARRFSMIHHPKKYQQMPPSFHYIILYPSKFINVLDMKKTHVNIIFIIPILWWWFFTRIPWGIRSMPMPRWRHWPGSSPGPLDLGRGPLAAPDSGDPPRPRCRDDRDEQRRDLRTQEALLRLGSEDPNMFGLYDPKIAKIYGKNGFWSIPIWRYTIYIYIDIICFFQIIYTTMRTYICNICILYIYNQYL